MQFGRYHRFGRLGAFDPDASFDTLIRRLTDDLDLLKKDHQLAPQLVIVSGDLAEWGLPAEFNQAREFLVRLIEHLNLGRDRVIIVPGNHDVNRKSCEAYFNTCDADGEDPVPPFWPKWKQYAHFFEEFYRALPMPPQFTVDELGTWYRLAELNIVVAGLNSTYTEIHDIPEKDRRYDPLIRSAKYGHFGFVGEEQLRWFAERLEPHKKGGVLRIGVVHHNALRGAVADDENLRDVNRVRHFLGGSLNLLLHGHTHDSKIGWLNPNLPVLSTGSAALIDKVLPESVPNQYQVIQVWPDRLERWTRRFDLEQKPGSATPVAPTMGMTGTSCIRSRSYRSIALSHQRSPRPS